MDSFTVSKIFDGESITDGPFLVAVDIDEGLVTDISPISDDQKCDFRLLCPGLVDVQMNGYGRFNVATANEEELIELDMLLAKAGTTSWLGTIVSAPIEDLKATLSKLDSIISKGTVRGLKGVHVEGPFLGKALGAHRPENIVPFSIEFIDALPSCVRLVTVAPEQVNAKSGIEMLVAKGITVSLGHSQPSDDEIEMAISSGASLVTHLFNGMSGVSHRCSQPATSGLALISLTDPRLAVGVIADMHHVNKHALNLAFKMKGKDEIFLVSDSIASSGHEHGSILREENGVVLLENGTLAGSCSPLSTCLKNLIISCVISESVALRAATTSPTKLVIYFQY